MEGKKEQIPSISLMKGKAKQKLYRLPATGYRLPATHLDVPAEAKMP
jgi:hypothetical protein